MEKINDYLQKTGLSDLTYSKINEEILSVLKIELMHIGFKKEKIDNYFQVKFIEKEVTFLNEITSSLDIYSKKFAPIVYELFLEQIIDYLVETKAALIILNLKYKGFFPTEFILELRNLKKLLQKSPENVENLRKYIYIQEKIIEKFRDNKRKIESLEDLENPRDKLQLIYSIFRILDFFNITTQFDFSHIKNYLKNNIDEWLASVPLITLKNPDLYFCGLYLAKHLNVEIDYHKVKRFLLDLYEENIDEFEAPLFEATDRVYYYLKSTEMAQLWLDEKNIKQIIKEDEKILESNYFQNFETSQLIVIIKIYTLLNVYKKIERQKIQAILDEIELRITSEGIKQYRDGFITSESTYYVIFINYMRNTIDNLKDYDLLDNIVSRIYRNLEFLDFSKDTNFDLISELFYSVESLKLLNCIETKQTIVHLAKYLFPHNLVEKILNSEGITKTSPRLRHFKVDKTTGETIY
ncbi:MAG: hypothetical protein ACFFBP_13260 [Promethearchaeota archaeon]